MTDATTANETRWQQEDLVVPPAPVLEAPVPRSALTVVLPVVMLAGTVGFLVIGGGSTTSLLMGGLMAVSLIGMIVSGGGRQGKPAATVAAERGRFLRSLDHAGRLLRTREAAARRDAYRHHPAPAAFLSRARDLQLTGSGSATAGIRIGLGAIPAVVRIISPDGETDTDAGSGSALEPFAAAARQRWLAAHRRTPAMPLLADLHTTRRLRLIGPAATDLARSVVLQWCFARPVRSGRVLVWAPEGALRDWEWVKWLPHNGHPHRRDALGPVRMITEDAADVRNWSTDADPAAGWLVVVVGRPSESVAAIRRDGGIGRDLIVVEVSPTDLPADAVDGWHVTTDSVRPTGAPGSWIGGTPDLVGAAAATAVARLLAARRDAVPTAVLSDRSNRALDLAGLLGVGAAGDFQPERHQRAPSGAARLRVPIGADEAGAPVLLDLKESAEGGIGPHGLVIGATGSGKSELLRTLVLALAATHTSRTLNFVLIDFKGGAGFLGLRELPHVAAVITNLADEQVLVERMRDALAGEVSRRQALLRAAGNLGSAADYERARRLSPELPPMPALVIICDEFTELLVQQPELADLFVMLGRLGRSLSIHLLMASQRMEEGRMRGLDAHLSYRIALKTFSAADSRAVLDVDDAYRLPSSPGVGFLKCGAAPPQQFRTAYVSALPASPVGIGSGARSGRPVLRGSVRLFTPLPVPESAGERTAETGRTAATEGTATTGTTATTATTATTGTTGTTGTEAATVLDLWVRRLRGRGAPAHPVWLPPLDEAPLLDSLSVPDHHSGTRLRVPVGLVDCPHDQRRDPLWADFTGSTGHGLVVGGARAGKSTLVTSLVLALARHHRPDEIHCYIVDLGGGGLGPVDGLPHVGGVVGRDEPARVRRLIAQLTTVLATREAGSGGRRDGDTTRGPDIFLFIDGWATFRADFEDLEPQVAALVQRGLSFGIHVVLTLSRWAEIRPALKDLMGLRLELRLGEPTESEVDRRRAAAVPTRSPGRGVTADGHHFLAAVPGPLDDPSAVGRLVAARRADWPGPGAPAIRMLPDRVAADDLPGVTGSSLAVPIGIGETDLAPVTVDFHTDPHLILWGDSGSGKTTFLRTLAIGIAARNPPARARFLVIDYRRTLLGAVPADHLAGHAGTAASATALIADVVLLMRSRLPGSDVTPQQLQDRSWWSGADLFVLVDDQELVAGGTALTALVELLPHARDIGLHLVVARRASGGARAGYEPVLQQLRELGSPGLVMSGPTDEGPLHSTQRARPLPPGRAFWVTRAGPAQLVQLAIAAD